MILQLQAKVHGLVNLGVSTCTYASLSDFKATFWIPSLPHDERNICINTRNTSSSYEISRFYVHDKDNQNYPKAGKLG